MSTNIDSLNISISASASQASSSLDSLARKLGALSNQLSGISKLNKNSFSGLKSAFSSIKNIKAPNITAFTNSLSRLGGKNVERAIQTLPQLANRLNQLMTVLSRSPGVSKDVIQLINSIARLNKVSNQSSTASTKTTGAFSKLRNMLPGLGKRTKSLASIFGNLYANFFWVIRGAQQLGKAVQSSMDYIEDYNYFNVTWEKVADEWKQDFEKYGYDSADSYAESFEKRLNETNKRLTGLQLNEKGILEGTGQANLGLDISQVTQYQASLGAVTNSLGLTGEESVLTAQALSNLAGDMSSLKNIDLETVMTNFQSGLIGQSRALYKYGIDITNATLQQYAYKYGIDKSLVSMTQAEKMQLRLLAILDQSQVAYGDLANTIEAPSNQLRILKANVQNLARTIGGLFMPIVSKVLPYINGFVNALQRLVAMFANLVGIEIDFNQFSEGYVDSDDLGGDAVEDLESSYDDASKAAEKYKKTILGIDQIHKLNEESSGDSGGSTGTGAGGTIDLTNEIADAVAKYQKVFDDAFANMENKVQKISDLIVESFETKDFYGLGKIISDSLKDVLNGIRWEDVYKGAQEVGSGFAQFLNGLFQPETFYAVGKTIASSLNTIIRTSLSFFETLDGANIGDSISAFVNGIIQNFDSAQFAKNVNKWAEDIKQIIIHTIKGIKWKDVVKAIGEIVLNLDANAVVVLGLSLLLKSGLAGTGVKLAKDAIVGAIGKNIASAFGVSSLKQVAPLLGKALATELAGSAGIIIPIAAMFAVTLGFANRDFKYQSDEEYREQKNEQWEERFGSDYVARMEKALPKIETDQTNWLSYVALEGIPEAAGNAKKALSELPKDISNWASNLPDKFASWKEEKGGAISDYVAERKEATFGWMNKDEEETDYMKSPDTSDRGLTFGVSFELKDELSTFAKGIRKKWDDLKENAFSFKLELGEKIEKVRDAVVEKWNGLKDKTLGFAGNITTKAQELRENMKNAWSNLSSKVLNFTSSITTKANTLRDNMKNAWANIGSKTLDFISSITTAASTLRDNMRSSWSGLGNKVLSFTSSISTTAQNLFSNFKSAWDRVKQNLNIGLKTPKLEISYNANGLANKFWKLLGFSGTPNFKISYYASGGFPTAGELFVANEAGPEMIGRMGSRSAVANTDQITEGISSAVYPAVFNAMMRAFSMQSGNGGNIEFVLNIEGKEVARAVNSYNKLNSQMYDVEPRFV